MIWKAKGSREYSTISTGAEKYISWSHDSLLYMPFREGKANIW